MGKQENKNNVEVEQPIRFCDYIVEQMNALPEYDYRYTDKQNSRVFHMALHNYIQHLILTRQNSAENLAALQMELNVWRTLTTQYDHVFKQEEKVEKIKKALLYHRITANVNITPEDKKLFKEMSEQGLFKMKGGEGPVKLPEGVETAPVKAEAPSKPEEPESPEQDETYQPTEGEQTGDDADADAALAAANGQQDKKVNTQKKKAPPQTERRTRSL